MPRPIRVRTIRIAFAALAFLAGSGAAALAATTFIPIIVPAAPPTVPEAQTGNYSAIHTVAVISAIGDHVTLRNDGFLTSPTSTLPIQDWNVDAGVEARLRQYLSGRFAFKDIMYDRAALAKIPNGPWDNSGKFMDFIKPLPHDGVDAFIVVRPDLEFKAPGLEGIGLEGAGAAPVLWTNYEIDVVDAQSDKLIAHAYSRATFRAGLPEGFAGAPAGPQLKFGDDFKLTPAQILFLRATTSILMNVSLLETVRALDFGVVLPPPGARTLVPIDPDHNPYKAYKNVAVVSGLGSMIGLNHMGGTIFSQDHFQADEPDWGLDAAVEARARAALAKQFHVVDPKVDRAAFANAQILDDDGKMAPSFPGLAQDPGIDLYVVFVKNNMTTLAANFPKNKGVGVFNHTGIVGPDQTLAYAHYATVVIDAHTMKVLGARSGAMAPDHPNIEPYEDVGNANWPAQPPTLTPDQASAIHDKLVDVLNQSVDETLLQLALLGVIAVDGPPAGAPAAVSQAQ